MTYRFDPHEPISIVARALGEYLPSTLFVGGSVISLIINEDHGLAPRVTEDVDIVVRVETRPRYHRIIEYLRGQGFVEQMDAPHCCRLESASIKLDIVPEDESVLGFGSPWYTPAMENATILEIDGMKVKVISPPYMLATKLKAFHDRGNSDIMASHDIEDLIAVVIGVEDIVDQTAAIDPTTRDFIREGIAALLEDPAFADTIASSLASARSRDRYGEMMKRFVGLRSMT